RRTSRTTCASVVTVSTRTTTTSSSGSSAKSFIRCRTSCRRCERRGRRPSSSRSSGRSSSATPRGEAPADPGVAAPLVMSLKYAVEKISDNHYVLPRTGDMKVEAHAFFSEGLYARSDEAMWHQLAAAASYEGVTGAYLMPDAHLGYGVPVGCVVVTDGVIIQAGSGYDISCGVLYMKAKGL